MVLYTSEYGNMAVRLLLGEVSNEDAGRWGTADWKKYANIAQNNLIVIRMLDELNKIGIQVDSELDGLVKHERERISRTIDLIGVLNDICQKEGIRHIFLKALQHYPDMGHDIDLLIIDNSRRLDMVLTKEFGVKPLLSNIANAISCKSDFKFDSYPSPVEIHHGRMGHVGEHFYYPKIVVKNVIEANLNDICVPIPSPEDQLLIQVIQRMYCHFYIRISDLVCSIKLLRMDSLNWDYILSMADKINITEGVSAYLGYVDEGNYKALGRNIIPRHIFDSLKCSRYIGLNIEGNYYRYPMLPVTSKIYLNKIAKDLISGEFAGALRSALITVVGIYYLSRNIGQRKSRYFE